jgi:hypothetical protein
MKIERLADGQDAKNLRVQSIIELPIPNVRRVVCENIAPPVATKPSALL